MAHPYITRYNELKFRIGSFGYERCYGGKQLPTYDSFEHNNPPRDRPIFAGRFNESDEYMTSRPAGMSDWLITYTVDGEGYFHTAAGEKRCAAGDVTLLRSHVPHQYGTVAGSRWNFIWAHFPGMPETSYLPNEEVLVQPIVNNHIRKRIYRALRSVLEDSREQRTLWHPLCENAIREVLLLVAERQVKQIDPRIEATLHLLSRQMREPLRIEDIAREINLSPSRLSHLFKQETGKSILDTLNGMRIHQAALLIAQSERTASEAALDVGFQNYNHFASLFRKHMGVSPRTYRSRLTPY